MAKLWRFALGQHFVNDIETGEFELADTTLATAAKMFDRIPDAQLWFERIGAEGVHKFNAVRPAYRGILSQ
jgi:hypothetical protein